MIIATTVSRAQEAAWRGLFELYEVMPDHWCIVGGQMVHLHCWEREVAPTRPTVDADTTLDVRARPQVLYEFTSALRGLGFETAGQSPDGHQHRWVRGEAQIDVLIPTNVGERASGRRGVTGGTTLESAGSQQALERSEVVEVTVGGSTGSVRRPDLHGSLVAKAAAYGNSRDERRERHLSDLAILAGMIRRQDRLRERLTSRDRYHLDHAVAMLQDRPELLSQAPAGQRGLELLRAFLDEHRTSAVHPEHPW